MRTSTIAVPDVVLVQRVRATLDRVVPRASAIEVWATRGTVALRGPIAAHERWRTRREVRRLPGVTRVDDELEPITAQRRRARGKRLLAGSVLVAAAAVLCIGVRRLHHNH